ENNKDGTNDNLSWNCGAEGATDDPAIRDLRGRQTRNILATLFLSQGVPMLLAGDETGQTQNGNNNAYCQDNELSWIDWELAVEHKTLLEFVQRLTALRREQPVLKRRNFFHGRKIRGADVKDVTWFEPAGKEMNDEAWNAGFVRCLGVLWAGDVMDEVDEKGEKIGGDTLLILLKAHHKRIPSKRPAPGAQPRWDLC